MKEKENLNDQKQKLDCKEVDLSDIKSKSSSRRNRRIGCGGWNGHCHPTEQPPYDVPFGCGLANGQCYVKKTD